jgi:predicted dehydrogenase
MSEPTPAPLRVALVGYGTGGRYFHAPFIAAADDIEVGAIVTRSPERRAQAAEEVPDAVVVDDLAAALETEPDLVMLTTPPATRRELVLQSIAAGVPTIADKPFATDVALARELRDAAAAAGVPLGVFHNRRWDADIRTVRAVLDSGELGAVGLFSSRFDLDDPGTFDTTEGGGMLRDLGSHVVDQAVWLFGPVRRVYAEVDHVDIDGTPVDSAFDISLEHVGGVHSHVSSTKLNRAVQREMRVLGVLGSFRSDGTDVQAQAIFAGRRPLDDPAWGYEAEERWGEIRTAAGVRRVPSAKGAYQDYYSAVARALRTGGPLPVTADDAVAVTELLDAARTSALEHRVVTLID